MLFAENRPSTSMRTHSSLAVISTDEDDESDETETHQGAYDVMHRISIADTHL